MAIQEGQVLAEFRHLRAVGKHFLADGQRPAQEGFGAIPLLLLISMVLFFILSKAPGGPLTPYLQNPHITAADIARLKHNFGLDRPLYVQYFRMSDFADPSGIFVFLDEHCDTINDGFFVNRLDDYVWGNLPASYHNGGVNMSCPNQ